MESNAVIIFFTYSLGDDKKFVVLSCCRLFPRYRLHGPFYQASIPDTLLQLHTRQLEYSTVFCFCSVFLFTHRTKKKHYTASCYLRATEHEFSVRLQCLHISKPCVRKSNTTV